MAGQDFLDDTAVSSGNGSYLFWGNAARRDSFWFSDWTKNRCQAPWLLGAVRKIVLPDGGRIWIVEPACTTVGSRTGMLDACCGSWKLHARSIPGDRWDAGEREAMVRAMKMDGDVLPKDKGHRRRVAEGRAL